MLAFAGGVGRYLHGGSRLIGILSLARSSTIRRLPSGTLQGVSIGIDPRHDPQGRFSYRRGPVIQRSPGKTQQQALLPDTEHGVAVIDQLAQFTSIRAVETFLATPASTPASSAACHRLEQLCLLGLAHLDLRGPRIPGCMADQLFFC